MMRYNYETLTTYCGENELQIVEKNIHKIFKFN